MGVGVGVGMGMMISTVQNANECRDVNLQAQTIATFFSSFLHLIFFFTTCDHSIFIKRLMRARCGEEREKRRQS